MATLSKTGKTAASSAKPKTAVTAKKAPTPKVEKAAPAKAVAPAKANKPAAPKAAKTTAPKKAASHAQRNNYIEVAAYYIAERRGFAPGDPLADWAEAEAEIDRLLAEGKLNA